MSKEQSITIEGEMSGMNRFGGLTINKCKKCGSNPDGEFTDGYRCDVYYVFCTNEECDNAYNCGSHSSPNEAVSKWNKEQLK